MKIVAKACQPRDGETEERAEQPGNPGYCAGVADVRWAVAQE